MIRTTVLLALLLLCGCEILEEDISREGVRIIAPVDGAAVRAGEVRFAWSAVEHAAGYAFTLVSPSFGQAGRIEADTVIGADSLRRNIGLRVALAPGRYEWSVTPLNSAYRGGTQCCTLTVTAADGEETDHAENRMP